MSRRRGKKRGKRIRIHRKIKKFCFLLQNIELLIYHVIYDVFDPIIMNRERERES